MKTTKLCYGTIHRQHSRNPVKLEITIEIEPGDDIDKAYNSLRAKVNDLLWGDEDEDDEDEDDEDDESPY